MPRYTRLVRAALAALALLPAANVLAAGSHAQAADQRPLFRYQNVDQAWAAAQTSRRPLFLYVTSDHCLYCKKMIKQTLSHPQISAGIAAYAEPIAFNASKSPELAKKLGVRAYPTTLVISPENQLLTKIEGFVSPEEFAQRVWPVLQRAEEDRVAMIRSQVEPASATVAQPRSVRQ